MKRKALPHHEISKVAEKRLSRLKTSMSATRTGTKVSYPRKGADMPAEWGDEVYGPDYVDNFLFPQKRNNVVSRAIVSGASSAMDTFERSAKHLADLASEISTSFADRWRR